MVISNAMLIASTCLMISPSTSPSTATVREVRGARLQGASIGWDILNREAIEALRKNRENPDIITDIVARALDLAEEDGRLSPPSTATNLRTLAALVRKNEDGWRWCGGLYRRALEIDEVALGPDHPDVATDLYSLAVCLHNEDCLTDAEPLYNRCLAIQEKALGPNHPDVAATLIALAELHRLTGRPLRSIALYERALAITETARGPAHPTVAAILTELAELHSFQRQFARSELLYRRAQTIYEKAWGWEHVTDKCLNGLAMTYVLQQRHAEAEPLCKRVVARFEKAMLKSPNALGARLALASSLRRLARLYRATSREEEAERLEQRATHLRKAARRTRPRRSSPSGDSRLH